MPKRRPHTKTRHGCATCKARKVRCDQEKPFCNNCTKGNRTCRYPNQLYFTLPTSLSGQGPATDGQLYPLRDMELLHHYTTSTYAAITGLSEDFEIWQVVVPRMAFSCPFLLHGILAVSALHARASAASSLTTSLMNVARYHQQHALSLYIPLLQSVDESNCHALFAFSIMISVTCFGMLHDDHVDDPKSLIDRYVDLFDALTGAAVVAIEAKAWLEQGELAPIMHPLEPIRYELDPVLEPGMRSSLVSLLDRAHQECFPPGSPEPSADADARLSAYRQAIYGVGMAYKYAICDDRPVHVVIGWGILVGQSYISLLRKRDPLAVVILGHYGVALHIVDNALWVLQDLGKLLTETVASTVEASWASSSLSWAIARVAEPPSPWDPN